ncbi:MAG: lytic transglycosylase domain-containing protein [Cyanobacteria bacterium SIG27]|nr:lytic transglycosylase domain-containing protein [Cyanobacteria bacterium SIG27]
MRIIFMTKKLVKTLLVALCVALIAPNTAFASQSPQENAKKLIVQTAQKLGVDPHIALSIAKIESNFNTTAKSSRGAIGLFQLTPNTAKKLGVNPYIVSENIEGGLKYYQMLYKKYGSMDLALAAYNAGPGNVAKYNGIPPFGATKCFIKNVKKEYNDFKADETTQAIISETL